MKERIWCVYTLLKREMKDEESRSHGDLLLAKWAHWEPFHWIRRDPADLMYVCCILLTVLAKFGQ